MTFQFRFVSTLSTNETNEEINKFIQLKNSAKGSFSRIKNFENNYNTDVDNMEQLTTSYAQLNIILENMTPTDCTGRIKCFVENNFTSNYKRDVESIFMVTMSSQGLWCR